MSEYTAAYKGHTVVYDTETPRSFTDAFNDCVMNRTIDLDKALNDPPPDDGPRDTIK